MQNINGWFLPDGEQDKGMLLSAERAANNNQYRDWHSNFIDDIVKLYAPNGSRRLAIDVGACVGMFSVPLAQEYAGVFSFEINPRVRECLNANVAPYKNVKVFGYGLGNGNAEVRFKDNDASGLAKIDNEKGDILLPIRSLDSFLIENLDLLKIDVEGYEWVVLKGARQTLTKNKPLVIVEIHSNRTETSYTHRQKIFSLMRELGYTLIDVRRNDYIWR